MISENDLDYSIMSDIQKVFVDTFKVLSPIYLQSEDDYSLIIDFANAIIVVSPKSVEVAYFEPGVSSPKIEYEYQYTDLDINKLFDDIKEYLHTSYFIS